MNLMNPHNELADHITRELIREIKTGRFSKERRLPPETRLAEEFSVSRNVIRDCLSRLQREGIVSRRPGVGTLINHRIADTHPRMDLNFSRASSFEGLDKKVEMKEVRVFETAADEEIAQRMTLPVGEPMLGIERLFIVDGDPAVFCCDYLLRSILPEKTYTADDFIPSTFNFLRSECSREVYNSLSEIRAVFAPEEIAEKLHIEKPEPLLHMSEVGFQYDGEPIIFIRDYLKDRTIPQWILRQKLE